MIKKLMGMSLITRIFIGLVLGAILGLTVPQWTGIAVFGKIFVSALKAIAPILVAVLVTASISKAGGGLGPRFRIVVGQYIVSTFIAAMCAVLCSMLFPITLQLAQAMQISDSGIPLVNLLQTSMNNALILISR